MSEQLPPLTRLTDSKAPQIECSKMASLKDDRSHVAVVLAAFDPPDSGMERVRCDAELSAFGLIAYLCDLAANW